MSFDKIFDLTAGVYVQRILIFITRVLLLLYFARAGGAAQQKSGIIASSFSVETVKKKKATITHARRHRPCECRTNVYTKAPKLLVLRGGAVHTMRR